MQLRVAIRSNDHNNVHLHLGTSGRYRVSKTADTAEGWQSGEWRDGFDVALAEAFTVAGMRDLLISAGDIARIDKAADEVREIVLDGLRAQRDSDDLGLDDVVAATIVEYRLDAEADQSLVDPLAERIAAAVREVGVDEAGMDYDAIVRTVADLLGH